MDTSYIDTSALASIVLRDDGWELVAASMTGFEKLASSNLLEAEMRSACARTGREFRADFVEGIEWIFPDRSLSAEMERILDAGYLRGADLFHVAVALYAVENPADISFITLDRSQRSVAAALGFQI